MGPPVSAAFDAGGQPTPAAVGFAKKNNVEVSALERRETPKGTYLAYRKQVRGKAAVDVLPDVMTGLLRELTFPKMMRWDASLDDGAGELPFGRPIRWLLFLYGGRVVPFSIYRTPLAQGPLVQEIRSGAVTFGHRFLTTSGRAGRAIKVKGFDDYRKRLAENFVVLEHTERQERIARELDVEARRRGGRVSRQAGGESLLREVPDLVEYPKVVSGTFAEEFLSLPEEVLTTTMIHHQHFFPLVNDQGKLQPVFLAVLNMEGDKPELIARNLERVLSARLRDARFFFDADRKQKLETRVARLSTVLFHKKLGSYAEKAERISNAGCDPGEGSPRDRRRRGARARGRAARQGRSRDRHGSRDDRAAGHDGRPLRPRGRPARGGVEGDLLPLPPGRRRRRRAAIEGPARRRRGDVGRGVDGRQARYGRRDVRRRGAADRLARSVRAAARRAGPGADPRRSSRPHRPRRRRDAGRARRDGARLLHRRRYRRGRNRSSTSCSIACATCSSSAASTCATCAR